MIMSLVKWLLAILAAAVVGIGVVLLIAASVIWVLG